MSVIIHAGRVALMGDLMGPPRPEGLIVFAHGSGSSRQSPKNTYLSSSMLEAGFATLMFDLLTPEEDLPGRDPNELRFDIPLLTERLIGALDWVRRDERLSTLPIGLFGAGTGTAAALIAATRVREVSAVVSRGGRPDLAEAALPLVRAPTLLIVGGADREAMRFNRHALARLHRACTLEVVPGASVEFEEPGALDRVCDLAAMWFRRHLVHGATDREPAGLRA